jgi:hypothetical protein
VDSGLLGKLLVRRLRANDKVVMKLRSTAISRELCLPSSGVTGSRRAPSVIASGAKQSRTRGVAIASSLCSSQ